MPLGADVNLAAATQQQRQPVPLHLHLVVPTPSRALGGHQPQYQGANPYATLNGNGRTSPPASDSRPYDQPGGVDGPDHADQQHLENSVPRDDNGDPVRHPDPAAGDWTRAINGQDPHAPGRNNNCVDVALSTVDTYSGNPTAAARRIPELDADGNPSDRGEAKGRDRIENALGAQFNDLGNGRDAYDRLEDILCRSGHGSQSVIITSDAHGRFHAWNAVNHKGGITYLDAQTGRTANSPLHSGDKGVFALPLDPDRRPTAPANTPVGAPDFRTASHRAAGGPAGGSPDCAERLRTHDID